MPARRPNVLWITTDQQRGDTVAALGNPHIRTPNLDRLCREGAAFTRAYCQAPVCTPSRASFLTGLYPSATHANRNGNAYFPQNERVRLLTRRLADAGYDCGLAGKLHLASAKGGREERVDDGYRRFWFSHSSFQGHGGGNEYGEWLRAQGVDPAEIFVRRGPNWFTRYKPETPAGLHQTAWCADRAIEFLNEPREGPWLMSVNPFDPHPPFDAPAAYRDRYDAAGLPPPLFRESDLAEEARLAGAMFQRPARRPGPEEQENKASYYGMVELIDENVGRLLRALEESGQRRNTLVIFTSDHGEMLGDHGLTCKGCRFYEGLVRVPLILSWPGVVREGLVSEALVELTDLAPTVAGYAGVELPWTHGRSLAPLLEGRAPAEAHRDFVRCEYYAAMEMRFPEPPDPADLRLATMYRDERWKLCVYHGLEHGQLFDLAADPDEFENRWHDPACREVRDRLVRRSFDATVAATDPGPPLVGSF